MGLISLLQSDPVAFFIVVVVLLLSLAFHEFAHAYVADRFGDPTPRSYGRVTLNPLKHLDPFGSLMLLFVGFGFARPVPINFNRLGRWPGMAAVAAGPISNLLIAVVAALLLRFTGAGGILGVALLYILSINIVLAVFNLLPIPLLDGSRILAALFPRTIGRSLMDFERLPYAFLIVFGFIWIAQPVTRQIIGAVQGFVLRLVGLI